LPWDIPPIIYFEILTIQLPQEVKVLYNYMIGILFRQEAGKIKQKQNKVKYEIYI
jgi:hypothetical protein